MSVSDAVYESEAYAALQSFYFNYLDPSSGTVVQVFESFTYGEMVIATLLFTLLVLYAFKWIWEVLR